MNEVPVEQAEIADLPEIGISLHALNGNTTNPMLRIRATVEGQEVSILINTGSTHNVLDCRTAKQLGCVVEAAVPLKVVVVDGFKIASDAKCKQFTWCTQGHKFNTEMQLLDLKGCDAVLGIQWLKTLKDCIFNFQELRMSFIYNGEPIT